MPNRPWSADDDQVLRDYWEPRSRFESNLPELAKRFGRSPAAVMSRCYTIGLKRWTEEQRTSWHQRAEYRRERIKDCGMSAGRRKPLAAELGMNSSYLSVMIGNLKWLGVAIPPADCTWGERGEREVAVQLWLEILNESRAEYAASEFNVISGKKCTCSHREGQHFNGICTAYAGSCDCPEFAEKRPWFDAWSHATISMDEPVSEDDDSGHEVVAPVYWEAKYPIAAAVFLDDRNRHRSMGYAGVVGDHVGYTGRARARPIPIRRRQRQSRLKAA